MLNMVMYELSLTVLSYMRRPLSAVQIGGEVIEEVVVGKRLPGRRPF